MFKFLKSMMWYIKPNWWRYVIVVIFGVLNGLVNLLPATIIARLTTAIESNTLTEHILIYEVFLPFLCYIYEAFSKSFNNILVLCTT